MLSLKAGSAHHDSSGPGAAEVAAEVGWGLGDAGGGNYAFHAS